MKKVIKRMQSPTPRFFRVLRNAGLALTAISSVLATAPVTLPAGIITVSGYLALAGGIVSAISQTAVVGDQ